MRKWIYYPFQIILLILFAVWVFFQVIIFIIQSFLFLLTLPAWKMKGEFDIEYGNKFNYSKYYGKKRGFWKWFWAVYQYELRLNVVWAFIYDELLTTKWKS